MSYVKLFACLMGNVCTVLCGSLHVVYGMCVACLIVHVVCISYVQFVCMSYGISRALWFISGLKWRIKAWDRFQ